MKLSKLSRSIEGKVAIVTGAASGMGRATAFVFADAGAKVAIMDVNAEPLNEVARRQHLSRLYLSQLAAPLKNASLLKSVWGNKGGDLPAALQ